MIPYMFDTDAKPKIGASWLYCDIVTGTDVSESHDVPRGDKENSRTRTRMLWALGDTYQMRTPLAHHSTLHSGGSLCNQPVSGFPPLLASTELGNRTSGSSSAYKASHKRRPSTLVNHKLSPKGRDHVPSLMTWLMFGSAIKCDIRERIRSLKKPGPRMT